MKTKISKVIPHIATSFLKGVVLCQDLVQVKMRFFPS